MALAVVTVAAVIVSVVLANREANRTDARLLTDRQRADEAIAAEAQRTRDREQRDRIVELLLSLSQALAVVHGVQSDPGRAANFEARALLAALPDDMAVFTRRVLNAPKGNGSRYRADPDLKYDRGPTATPIENRY